MTRRSVSWWWAGYARLYDLLWRGPLTDRLGDELVRRLGGDAGRVLDAGIGTGLIARRIRAGAHVIGMDANASMLIRARRRSDGLVVADAARPPFAPGTFDAVVAANLLHLCDQPELVVAALLSLIRPGGSLVLCWPHEDVGPWRLYQAEHRHGVRRPVAVARLAIRYFVGASAMLAGHPSRTPAGRLRNAVDRAGAPAHIGPAHEIVLDGLTRLAVLRPAPPAKTAVAAKIGATRYDQQPSVADATGRGAP